MDIWGLELRELHVLIVIGLLLIGGVIKIILQISSMSFELRLFKDHAEKRMDQTEKRIDQHESELKEHRKEITELLKEIRDNREEMRLALMKKS